MKVLLVDDDPDLRELLSNILKMKGIESVPAETGAEALARIERQDIDVALIDLKLEDMSGLDVLRGIKERSSKTECILLTGNASQATAIEAINLGAYAYFQKPYDVEQLLVVIRRAAEKRATEEALKKSEARYRDLVENSQDLICTHDLQGNLLYINEAGTKISGYSNEILLKMNLRDILAPEVRDRFEAYLAEIQAKGQAHGLMRIQTAAGEIRYLEFKNTLQTESLAAPVARGTARDVTERMRAEEALQNSEKRFRALIENGRDNISLLAADGTLLWESPSTISTLGYAPNQFVGRNIFELMHPDDQGWTRDLYAQVVQTPGRSQDGTFRLRHGDGTWHWIESTTANMLNEPSVRAIVVNYRDITARKQAEQKLRENETRLRQITDNMLDVIGLTDTQGVYEYVSPSVKTVLGYEPSDILGKTMFENVHPNDLYRVMRVSMRALRAAQTGRMELRYRHADDHYVWLESTGTPVLDSNGRVIGAVTSSRDITERKQAETELRALSTRQEAILAAVPDILMEVDKDKMYTWANPAGFEFFGEDVIGKEAAFYFEGEQDVYGVVKPVFDGSEDVIYVESWQRRKDGEKRLLAWWCRALKDTNGNVVGALSSAHDITERKQAKEALRENEKKYQVLTEISPVGIFRTDAQGSTTYVNPRWSQISGLPAEDALGDGWLRAVHPQDRAKLSDGWKQATSAQTASITEYRFVRPDGSIAWVLGQATPEKNIEDQVIGYVGTITDITERKQAEEALRKNEADLKEAQRVGRFGSWDWDATTDAINWSEEYYRIYGFDPKQRPPGYEEHLKAYTPESAERLDAAVKKSMQTGMPYELDLERASTDGARRWVTARCEIKRGANGQIVGLRGTAQDITERKLAEEELRESEEMLRESQRIAGLGSYVLDFASGMWTSSNILDEIFGIDETYIRSIGSWAALIHPDDRDQMLDYFTDEIVGKHAYFDKEYRIIRDNDKAERWVHGLGKLELDERSQPIRLRGTILDITQRKLAEKELRALSTRQEAILSAVPDILMEVDKEKMYTWANPAGFEFFGEDVIGKEAAFYFEGEQDTYGAVKPLFNSNEDVIYVESWQRRKDGEKRLLAWWCRALKDTNGNVVGALSSAHDITERKRAEDEIRRRAEELAALYESSQALAGKISLDDVLQTITKSALRLFDAAGVGLHLYDPATRMLEVKLATHPTIPIGLRLSLGEGLAGKVAQTRRAMRIDDYAAWEGRSPQYEGIPVRATLETPLIYQDELVGVLVVHEAGDSQRKFTEADERLISLFATQAAAAIQNARLFEDLRLRLSEMETLQAVASACMTTENEDALLTRITELISETLYPDNFGFVMMGENGAALLPRPSYRGVTLESIPAQIPLEGSIAGRVAASGQPYRTGDVRKEEIYLEINAATRSEICVPMLAGERVLGVINAESHQVGRFSAQDERLLTILAGQVTTAIEHLRAQAGERQHLTELKMLYESGLALSQLLSPKEFGQKIIELLEQKMNWHHTAIRLCRLQDDTLELLAFKQPGLDSEAEKRAVEERFKTLVSKSSEGLSGWAVQNSRTVRSGDVGNDPRYMDTYPGLHSGLYVPMKSSQRIIGVISIESEQPNAFSEADERLVSTLAAQAASALENARLFEETRQRVKELETLNRVSIALRAISKQEAMLAVVLEETLNALNASDGSINLLNNATGKLHEIVARGWPSEFSEALIQPGEGLFGNVFVSGNTHISRDLANDPLTRPEMRGRLPTGWGGACIPIRSTEQTLGVMLIAIPGEREFSKEQVRLLHTLAEMTGNALQRASLYEETFRRLRHLESLRVVDRAIAAGSLDRRVTLNILLDQVVSQLGVDAADVLLLNSPLQTLLFAAGQGFHTGMNEMASVRVSESFAGYAVLERRLIHIEDRETASENQSFFAFWQNEGFSNYYAVPLITKGQVKGVLEVFRRSPFTPDPEWVNFLETLADQTAIAIDNAQLFENLQSANLELILAYDATIEGWSRAMDLRDHETEGHTQRVTEMTLSLAQAFGLNDQEILHIRRGALLHDIGKMGVPDHILLKPGKLVDMEWALMQKHPQLAYEMLQPIQYLRESLDIPYCHHEKWDGTGYPQGLKGERIPLAARLFAIVDVYDALISDRPYRNAWPKAKALKYIRGLSGLQFDPQVVNKFMEMFGDEKSKV